jgi:phosphate transport system substrate-binding protein
MPERARFYRNAILPIALACLSLPIAGSFSAVLADTLIIQGSTTFARRLMEPYQAAIEAASGQELTVIPNKSTPGLIALLEGRAHMAMISAPLQSEIDLVQKAMPGLAYDRLRAFEIARTRVAVAVHASNPLRKASRDSITRILTGEINNWKALGGPNIPVKIILVGGGGGVTVAVEGELLKGKPVSASNVIHVKTPVQLVQVVEQEPGAIGFAQIVLVRQRNLEEIALDSPIEQQLNLVTFGEPTAATLAVIKAAQRIAAEKLM